MSQGYRHPEGTYEGDVNPDTLIPHGYGSYYYKNGDEYKGNFDTSIRQGFGVMKYANGDRFEGDFHRNLAQGPGRYDFANGDVHMGNYLRGKRHGHGRLLYANGDEYEGRFRKGQKRDNHAKFIYNNGDIYYGKFKEDQPCGRGKLIAKYSNIPKCSECNGNDATRKCIECEDTFCNLCYDDLHSSRKKREHTYEHEKGEEFTRTLDVWNGVLIEIDHKGNYLNYDPALDVEEEDSDTSMSSEGTGESGANDSRSSLTTPLTLSRTGSPTLDLEKSRPYSPAASLADAMSAASFDETSVNPKRTVLDGDDDSLASAVGRMSRK